MLRGDVRPIVGSNVAWDDEPDHRGPWLVAQGSTATRFPILSDPKALLGDFERASRNPTDAAINRLANRYGWLREPSHLVDPVLKGKLKRVILRDGDILLGQHIGEWYVALTQLRDLFEVWTAVRELEAAATAPQAGRNARTLLRARIKRSKGGVIVYVNDNLKQPLPFFRKTTLLSPGRPEAENIAEYLRPDPELRAARLYLALELNKALRDGWAYPVLMPLRQDVIRVFPRAALAAVHLALMISVAGGVPERACERCGDLFDAHPRHKRFCSRACKEAARKERGRTS